MTTTPPLLPLAVEIVALCDTLEFSDPVSATRGAIGLILGINKITDLQPIANLILAAYGDREILSAADTADLVAFVADLSNSDLGY